MAHGVHVLADATELLDAPERLRKVEREIAAVPGHGSGARAGYLWMLLGSDGHIKPDCMVLRWLGRVLARAVSTEEAVSQLREAARRIGCTPWELDHAIWRYERARRR